MVNTFYPPEETERAKICREFYDACEGHNYQSTGWVVGGKEGVCYECTKCGATVHDLDSPEYCFIAHPYQVYPRIS